MNELQGRIGWVTGGSRGIGRAIVMALADAGADVAFTYKHSKDMAGTLVKAICEKGQRCRAYQADAGYGDEMAVAMKQALSDLGPISILINNAGMSREKSFTKTTRTLWDEVIHVNLDGVFYTTQLVLQDMIGAGWGRIILISCAVGQTGDVGQAGDAATKGAVSAFTANLSREMARKGIAVHAVASGFVETGMAGAVPEAASRQVKSVSSAGLLGEPEEVADAVVLPAGPPPFFATCQAPSVHEQVSP